MQTISLLAALAMCLTSPLFSQGPDLTKDSQSVGRKLTYNPGGTGLRGWSHTKAANNLDAAQVRTTVANRQILVAHVGAASPADGVVMLDDVSPGVDGRPCGDDARHASAAHCPRSPDGPPVQRPYGIAAREPGEGVGLRRVHRADRCRACWTKEERLK